MPDHSDDEQAIDDNSFIANLSLGSKRKHNKALIASVTLSDVITRMKIVFLAFLRRFGNSKSP